MRAIDQQPSTHLKHQSSSTSSIPSSAVCRNERECECLESRIRSRYSLIGDKWAAVVTRESGSENSPEKKEGIKMEITVEVLLTARGRQMLPSFWKQTRAERLQRAAGQSDTMTSSCRVPWHQYNKANAWVKSTCSKDVSSTPLPNIPIMARPPSEAGAAVADSLSSPKVAESLGASLDMAVAEALADYCDKVRWVGRCFSSRSQSSVSISRSWHCNRPHHQ